MKNHHFTQIDIVKLAATKDIVIVWRGIGNDLEQATFTSETHFDGECDETNPGTVTYKREAWETAEEFVDTLEFVINEFWVSNDYRTVQA